VGGYRIEHAYDETRRAAQDYLRRWHYLASDGNQGFMFAVVADDNTVAGACQTNRGTTAEVALSADSCHPERQRRVSAGMLRWRSA
jgi:hypothetical protein